MAVRSDAANDRLSRSGGAPDPQTAFTVCGWFYLSVDRDDFSTLIRLHASSGSTTRITLATGSSGTLPAVFTPGNTSGVLGVDSFTVGAWLFVAVTQTGTTATIYTCTPGGTMHSASGTSSGGSAPDGYTIFGRSSSDASEWFNGRAACVRLWSAVLNSTELAAERDSFTAIRTTNLYADYRLADAATALNDSGPGGRTLTAGSTAVTTEADPPIGTSAADTLTGVRVGQFTDTTTATVVLADSLGAARAGGTVDTAAIGRATSDQLGAARTMPLADTAAVGVTAPDITSGARTSALPDGPAVGVTRADTPDGVRVASLPETVANGLILPDLLGGVRAYGLPDNAVTSLQLPDTAGGVRVGGPAETTSATLILLDVIGHTRVSGFSDVAASGLVLPDLLSAVRAFGLPSPSASLSLPVPLGSARVSSLAGGARGGDPTGPRDLTVSAQLQPSRFSARLLPPRFRVKEAG